MRPKFQKRSALKFVGRIIPCAKHIGISREAEDEATSRRLWRIHPPAGAGRFQIAGLTLQKVSAKEYCIKSMGLK